MTESLNPHVFDIEVNASPNEHVVGKSVKSSTYVQMIQWSFDLTIYVA
jgi:hypothetical protein